MAKRAKEAEAEPKNVDPNEVAACYAEYTSLMSDSARLGQKMATMLGRYEKMGVDKKSIKHAYKMASQDPDEARSQHERNTEYLQMLGIVTWDKDGQAGFAETLAPVAMPSPKLSERVRVARAHSDGFNSGLAGGSIDNCQFSPGSEEFVSWRDGWSDGHSDRLARNPDADKAKVATPRKKKQPALELVGAEAGA